MKVKTIVILFCALTVCFLLAACGKSNAAQPASDTGTVSTESTTPTTPTESTESSTKGPAQLAAIHQEVAGFSETANCSQCHKDGRTAQNY
jgi:hypothetical protein